MSERLTDEQLEALMHRFSERRHPKVHAALVELWAFRLEESDRLRQRRERDDFLAKHPAVRVEIEREVPSVPSVGGEDQLPTVTYTKITIHHLGQRPYRVVASGIMKLEREEP